MKLLVVLVVCFALASGVLGYMLLASKSGDAAPIPASAADLQALQEEVASLTKRLQALDAKVVKLAEAGSASARAQEASQPADPGLQLEETVRRVVEEWAATQQAGSGGGIPQVGAEAVADAAPGGLTAEEAFLRLSTLDNPDQSAWDEVRAAGLLDAVVSRFEQRAKREGTPDALVDMGHAYLQKVFEAGAGPKAGEWANKADAAYDQALVLDDKHWEARFSKAVNLSFWPPMFGKQPEAIRHLEILVEQQRAAPSEKRYAQTYLILGNLHSQTGDSEKAAQTWQEGSGLFPENTELREQLGAGQPR